MDIKFFVPYLEAKKHLDIRASIIGRWLEAGTYEDRRGNGTWRRVPTARNDGTHTVRLLDFKDRNRLVRTDVVPGRRKYPVVADIDPDTVPDLRSLPYLPDTLSVQWDLSGKLFNRIPLLKHLKWREVIGFKTLYGDLTDKNNPYKQAPGSDLFLFPSRNGAPTSFAMGKTPYMELNVGVHNIFKFLRVDYVRRLNYLGLPNVKKNGVRFVLQFDF